MLDRRHMLTIGAGALLMPGAAMAATGLEAPLGDQGTELGPEATMIAARVGLWDVTETLWETPSAAPKVTTGLVAQRRMIGPLLQETLHAGSDLSAASMLRLDYLMYERTEGRWNYVSMDIRVPVGIMPAWSFDRGTPDHIALTFQPFAHGGAAAGQMLRMEQVIARQDAAHDTKDQRFLPADGTGTSWLAHRYAYVRRVG